MSVYASPARRYLGAGWSPLPLPARRKKEPPAGFTGRGAPMASGADVEEWCDARPGGNIALRLPPGVIGIDVDGHKGPAEAEAWNELVTLLGPLPESAPWCTSRDDGLSGIRLLAVPDGYVAADMGPAGEVIQHHHRYVVAPPSIHPDTGKPYRWIGQPEGWIPNVADLPALPPSWLDKLRAGSSPAGGSLFQQPGAAWTPPDVNELAVNGVAATGTQDKQLADLVYECARSHMSDVAIRAVWDAAVARTPLARPSEPWTDDDFTRHYVSARRKLGNGQVTGPAVSSVPVDGAGLLDAITAFLRAYVAFPSSYAAVAVALWAAHTYLIAVFGSTPRLALLSPEKQCGKTRVLELLELLCAGAEMLSDASPAYLYRRIGAGQVTILLDEADAIWKRGKSDESAEALRSIVNAGHRRSATVGRVEMSGQAAKLVKFPVYAPAAIAGIGNLPDTITDRAVVIHMRRRSPDQPVRSFRERITRPEGEELREQLTAWCGQIADKAGDLWPELPPGVTDRKADVWEPLVAIADLAGGDWPRLAREACTALVTGATDDTETVGTRLLADLRTVWRGSGTSGTSGTALASDVPDVPLVPYMATDDLLNLLHNIEEAPWADWYGHPLNPRDLAKLLKPYGVGSVKIRIGDLTPRGYRVADLIEPWRSYLPAGSATSATSATPLIRHVADVADTPQECAVCGEPLDKSFIEAGFTDHGICEATS